jgi:hypothetical protein
MRGGAGRLPVGRLQSPPDTSPARAPFTHDYRQTPAGYGLVFKRLFRYAAGLREELRASDDLHFAVALDGLEVVPVLRDDCRVPTARTSSEEGVECHAL